MIITKSWLQSCRTSRGGWTKAQADILGLPYPLTKGWQQKVIGRPITEQEKRMFEIAACKTTYSQLSKVMGMVRRLNKDNQQDIKAWINDNF